MADEDTCLWSEDGDGVWWACDANAVEFKEGGPMENIFKYCPFCGKRTESKPNISRSLSLGIAKGMVM